MEIKMKNIKAILLMVLWTSFALTVLYILGAFENFRDPVLVILISLSLLSIHITNMFIYFRVGGNEPYKWRKLN